MTTTAPRRRLVVRHSKIHGRGVYALTDLGPNERVLEYRGEVLSWSIAKYRDLDVEEGGASLTYFFDRGDGTVIDGAKNGNSSRYINHGCAPNCEAVDVDGRIYIHTLISIRAGDELLIDYALATDDSDDAEVRALYTCSCAAPTCRGTMLADR